MPLAVFRQNQNLKNRRSLNPINALEIVHGRLVISEIVYREDNLAHYSLYF
jgi:hypothetical protein